MHVITQDAVRWRSLRCPVPPGQGHKLQGVRLGGPEPLQTDIWPSSAGGQAVSYWTEPLTDVCAAATTAGFLIAELIEPRPARTMRDRYPGTYDKLSQQPFFLILRLLKQ